MDYSLYMCMEKKKKEKKNYKSKFSGESKGGQNNQVLEKLRNQKGVPVN